VETPGLTTQVVPLHSELICSTGRVESGGVGTARWNRAVLEELTGIGRCWDSLLRGSAVTKNGKQWDRNRSQSLPRGQQAGSEQQLKAEDRKIVRTASFPPSEIMASSTSLPRFATRSLSNAQIYIFSALRPPWFSPSQTTLPKLAQALTETTKVSARRSCVLPSGQAGLSSKRGHSPMWPFIGTFLEGRAQRRGVEGGESHGTHFAPLA